MLKRLNLVPFGTDPFYTDEFTLDSIGITPTVEDIYHRVKNDDVIEYLAQKELELSTEIMSNKTI